MSVLIAPVVRRFVLLRESIDSRERTFRKRPAFAAILELEVNKRELVELLALPQVTEFLQLEREQNDVVGRVACGLFLDYQS